jgi:DNA transformation protein
MGDGFRTLLAELFEPVGGVTMKRMFGGTGIFRDGIMFGLIAGDVLYFRVDPMLQPTYEAAGSEPWSYRSHRGEQMQMPYWRAPDELFDDPDMFRDWAIAAFEAADRAKRQKPGGRK